MAVGKIIKNHPRSWNFLATSSPAEMIMIGRAKQYMGACLIFSTHSFSCVTSSLILQTSGYRAKGRGCISAFQPLLLGGYLQVPSSTRVQASFLRLRYLPTFLSPSARPLGEIWCSFNRLYISTASSYQYPSECSSAIEISKSGAKALSSNILSYLQMQRVISLPGCGASAYFKYTTFMPALHLILINNPTNRFHALRRSVCATEMWNFQSATRCSSQFWACQYTRVLGVYSLMKPLLQRASKLSFSEMVQRLLQKNSYVKISGTERKFQEWGEFMFRIDSDPQQYYY